MKVHDFSGCYEVTTAQQLAEVLSRRYLKNENWYWMTSGNENEPSMTVAVKAELATLHYMRNGRDAGFRSLGNVPGLNPDEDVTFLMDRSNTFEVRGDAIVPFSVALAAAKEFFLSKTLPRSVEWFEI